ncbi:hypothetical protein [Pedobacter panaciterrae]
MKNHINTKLSKSLLSACLMGAALFLGSCKKNLDYVSYGDLNSVVKTAAGAGAVTSAAYTGLAGGGDWQGGWTA